MFIYEPALSSSISACWAVNRRNETIPVARSVEESILLSTYTITSFVKSLYKIQLGCNEKFLKLIG